MGRREDRAELQSTWYVLEPRVAGVPIRKKDMEDAVEVAEQEAERARDPVVALHAEMARVDELPRRLIGQGSR